METEYESLPCVYCREKSNLVRTEMTFQRGLVKVKVPQSHYLCTSCKKTFLTREQIMNNGTALTPHTNKLNQFTEGKANTLTTPPENNAQSK